MPQHQTVPEADIIIRALFFFKQAQFKFRLWDGERAIFHCDQITQLKYLATANFESFKCVYAYLCT